jgi:hypothetical protein
MKSSQAIANWLFDRVGLDVALTGDLLEERGCMRSALWYWRQILIGVCVGIRDALRTHKVDALRVVAVGFAMQYLGIFLWARASFNVPDFSLEQWMIQSWGVLLVGVMIGWLIADREHPLPTVILFMSCMSIWFLGSDLFWVKMVVASVDRPTFRPEIVLFFMTFFSENAGLLIGGMLVRPRKPA